MADGLAERERSPHNGFGVMSRVYDGIPAPPPWPPGDDPRTDACRHDWPCEWGRKGERQHRCDGCGRWIWDRAIWPVEKGA